MLRIVGFVAIVGTIVAGAVDRSKSAPRISATLPLADQFEAWTAHYGMAYTSDEDRAFRFGLFSATANKVHAHNAKHDAGKSTYRQGLNYMAAHTKAEYTRLLGFKPSKQPRARNFVPLTSTPVAAVDWRAKGAVTYGESHPLTPACTNSSGSQGPGPVRQLLGLLRRGRARRGCRDRGEPLVGPRLRNGRHGLRRGTDCAVRSYEPGNREQTKWNACTALAPLLRPLDARSRHMQVTPALTTTMVVTPPPPPDPLAGRRL
jgi:hypothetical protein